MDPPQLNPDQDPRYHIHLTGGDVSEQVDVSRVTDPHHFTAGSDLDLAFHFNADPDPAFHFNADPDPASRKGVADPRPLAYRPSRPPF